MATHNEQVQYSYGFEGTEPHVKAGIFNSELGAATAAEQKLDELDKFYGLRPEYHVYTKTVTRSETDWEAV